MHTWVWGTTYPDFMDALLPLASLPVEIAGRNRMLRKMIVDSIESDPEWRQGEYTAQPRGLVAAIHVLLFMVSSPRQWQKEAPTRAQAEALLATLIKRYSSTLDANDVIYQFEASRAYDPLPHLDKIRVPLFAINSADDQINPPELGILDDAIRRVRKAGKAPGILTGVEADARRWLECGGLFVAVGADVGVLARETEKLAAKFKP